MSDPRPTARPGSVTTVVVLTWIVALFSILAGVLLLVASDQVLADAGLSTANANAYAWGEIIFGVITALVAIGLGNGNNLSRLLVTALMALRAALSVWVAIVLWGHAGFWSAVLAGLIAVLVLVLLWNDRANQFFRTN
ncbi:MAG: hypothetical protein WCA82_06200 [Jiangellales bacterium]